LSPALLPSVLFPLLFPSRARAPRLLHSFPTRRSSDLASPSSLTRCALIAILACVGGRLGSARHFLPGTIPVSMTGNNGNPFSPTDRKSTRLNSSHVSISYAVFCLKKKNHEMHGRGARS